MHCPLLVTVLGCALPLWCRANYLTTLVIFRLLLYIFEIASARGVSVYSQCWAALLKKVAPLFAIPLDHFNNSNSAAITSAILNKI